MQRLLAGVLNFRRHIFQTKRELFSRLATTQNPQALFITCSDSRICPSLITQSSPGDLFVVRNAGNIVPPWPHGGGETASIEYAVEVLKVRDIVVCGHTHCGAMAGILEQNALDSTMPALAAWLQHADAAYKFVAGEYGHLPKHMQMERLIEANVLLQIESLATIPAVAKALARDELDIYGWVYRIENGEVRTFNLDSASFEPVTDALINAPRGVPTLVHRVSAETCDTDIESVR